MEAEPLATEFAPAERSGLEELRRQQGRMPQNMPLRLFMDAMPNMVMVLNRHRQIVFFNQALAKAFAGGKDKDCIGLRPGELLGCVHSRETPGGCGTTRFCGVCGSAKAILSSLAGSASVEECRIMTKDPAKVFDLRVWATPFQHEGENYCIFAVTDISDEKRRAAIERIFFHDVLNTAGAVRGLAEILAEGSPEEAEACRRMLVASAEKLIEEIYSQRDLSLSERGELKVKPIPVASVQFLDDIAGLYRSHPVVRGRTLAVDPGSENLTFSTDRTLLSRVIGNMLKNALEAASAGSQVALGCRREDGSIVFWVNNPGVIPGPARLQIFQRSFSTKGVGRGLGTYSMRLLAERYLRGGVSFESDAEKGTTFYARIPLA